MLALAIEYYEVYGGSAVREFVAGLMEGDPAKHKRGYSRENAIIAAADAFEMTTDEIRRLMS